MRRFNIAVLMLFCSGCAAVPPTVQKFGNFYQQAVVVRTHAPGSSTATLSLWERQENRWHRVLHVPAMIGRNGLALPGEKKEGDGKTPAGLYSLGTAFGYAPYLYTGLDYRMATPDDVWVDDPQSAQYNQWIRGMPDAKSFEKLKRDDTLYKFGAVIEYNTRPVVPGAGSAIFMHIWRRYDHPTAGCVALSERYLRKVLKRLDKNRRPVIILENGHG